MLYGRSSADPHLAVSVPATYKAPLLVGASFRSHEGDCLQDIRLSRGFNEWIKLIIGLCQIIKQYDGLFNSLFAYFSSALGPSGGGFRTVSLVMEPRNRHLCE